MRPKEWKMNVFVGVVAQKSAQIPPRQAKIGFPFGFFLALCVINVISNDIENGIT
jgi:hypothetical protein